MDHKIKVNKFTKECEGLMNPLDNKIVRKNYLTIECRDLLNPKSFDLSFKKDVGFINPLHSFVK